ncbi:MAG: hypothetical protein VKL20_08925 [Synechocystis sp.]|nr:hypothetical protein [Synechocystis sp.]
MESNCWTPERLSELGELWAIARGLEQSLQTPPPKRFLVNGQPPSDAPVLVPALAAH